MRWSVCVYVCVCVCECSYLFWLSDCIILMSLGFNQSLDQSGISGFISCKKYQLLKKLFRSILIIVTSHLKDSKVTFTKARGGESLPPSLFYTLRIDIFEGWTVLFFRGRFISKGCNVPSRITYPGPIRSSTLKESFITWI